MTINCSLANQVPSGARNDSNCENKIRMARPFTKPIITGYGTRRINLPNFNTPTITCITPANTRVANRYCIPRSSIPRAKPALLPISTALATTTAIAPVAPEIMPGRPPIEEVIRPRKTADHKPTIGSTPAINEKAMASGTRASATVNPDKVSSFQFPFFLTKKLKNISLALLLFVTCFEIDDGLIA